MGGTDVNSNELAHHGIFGMKWGVRRYQNKDGTLTAAGKKQKTSKKNNSLVKGKAFVKKHSSLGWLQAAQQWQNQAIATANSQFMQNHMNVAISNANITASLGMSYGMNPFMF
jgi:hypothetical protein